MSETLESIFEHIDKMLIGCRIDYDELKESSLDEDFFQDYSKIRIVNSFLFNFGKLQDKIGAKLFKQVLFELKEIDSFSQSMIDVLNLLEQRGVLDDISTWDRLREIRNIISHEYPYNTEERVENISLALDGFEMLENIYARLQKIAKAIP